MSKFTYTFKEADAGKIFRLTATDNSNNTTSILINCKSIQVDPGEVPIEESSPTGAFPAGTSDEAFAIIYHIDEDMYTTADLDYLNEAAAIYMNNFYGSLDENNHFIPSTDYTNKKYYGADENGLYVLIPYTEESDVYSNQKSGSNYKVYIRGWCEIVDIGDLGGNTVPLQMANGYYYDIEGELYLFINTKLNLVNFADDYSYYWYDGEVENPNKEDRKFISKTKYKIGGSYIKYANNGNPLNLKDEETSMMIDGGAFSVIITPSMLTSVSNFFGGPNVNLFIISKELEEIGDYAFYNSSLSGLVILEDGLPKLRKIGNYAFSGCSNLPLFLENGATIFPESLQEIGDYAFYRTAGINSLNFTRSSNLEYVGIKAFSECGNLETLRYLQKQVEPDGNSGTQLLYLPPMEGLPRVSGEFFSGTMNTLYDYTDVDWITQEEKVNGKIYLTFYNSRNGSGMRLYCE